MKIPFRVIIPARYLSSRLPGKPLLDIGGQTMLERVYRQAIASGATSVAIATDDDRIGAAMRILGATVVMTSVKHQSGTDRIAEAAKKLQLRDNAIVVNVQGDEPLIPPALIRQCAELLHRQSGAVVATLATPIVTAGELQDPNVVKVVVRGDGMALYFSRAVVPWRREAFAANGVKPDTALPHLRHLGIYAYRVGFLKRFSALSPAAIEQAEALEQLRILWHGEQIAVTKAIEAPPPGVDTEADLEQVRRVVARS
ncbi:3-deoxy-manno-octulosonate cytidylyltransferase [Ectothiorhodospiraceae bacterium BW-2]|nr:3-deoxy-manno-octulosonate cytidylyltransferase [Ectothiorhodospiraceae bacterium BW-2]